MNPEVPWSVRTQATFLLGSCRIYKHEVLYLHNDSHAAFTQMRKVGEGKKERERDVFA